MKISQEEIKTTEEGSRKTGKTKSGGNRSFLDKYKSLFGGSLFLAVAFHVLLLIGFGSYTLFKGSAPRMPFTSEGGVPAEDVGMEAPPENAPDMVEETSNDSSPTPSDAAPAEMDTVLAVAGAVSPSMSFDAAPPVVAPAMTGGAEKLLSKTGGTRSSERASAVNFFGVKGEGTNVYFVMDVSDSMLENDRGAIAGYAAVKNNLKQMIRSLDEETRFNVVAYGASGADLFQLASVPATAEMKKQAESFIAQYNLSSEKKGTLKNNYRPKIEEFGIIRNDKGTDKITTRLDLGLLASFEGLADTIFLISDGKAPVIAEDNREEAKEAMKGAEISDQDRAKYEKEISAWREEYKKYVEELKAYRSKYSYLLVEKERKIAEAKAKGQGKVVEGKGVDYGVKISGLPPAPKEPTQPKAPTAKVGGKVVSSAGKEYDTSGLIQRIRQVYTMEYKKKDAPTPSIHTVGYMSKPNETKFLQDLAAKNNGKFTRITAPIQQ
jgi:hypothetical protein